MKKKGLTSEDRIKRAATMLFVEKGYEATTTRDIAAEAEVNVALINYYFRSKERLHALIVEEMVGEVFDALLPVIDDEASTIEEKLMSVVDLFTAMLLRRGDMPLFVLTEIGRNPKGVLDILPLDRMRGTALARQLGDRMGEKVGNISYFNHLMINLMGMLLMPVLIAPLSKGVWGLERKAFVEMMNSRKMLIPMWVSAMAAMAEN